MLQWLCVLLTFVFLKDLVVGSQPGPWYPATKGKVWPKPLYQTNDDTYFNVNVGNFEFWIINKSCPLLIRTLQRYIGVMKTYGGILEKHRSNNTRNNRDLNYLGNMRCLKIYMQEDCEDYPYYGMDESYTLVVSESSFLKSKTVWGIMRGLETFTHLFYLTDDFQELRINSTMIIDYPRSTHRGLLLDTSRHFLTVGNIMKTLDAMAMNKMNVLHWHIVDDQSFPYQSDRFPELSVKGAYHSSMVYSKEDIQNVINYARDRGIRVIAEFDVPGHTRSWGVSHPELLTQCSPDPKDLGPLNPIKNETYKFLKDLLKEVQELFPDKYFYIGGDEVNLNCWLKDPEIAQYMKLHNLTKAEQLHMMFMKNTLPLLAKDTVPIVWQEVFDNGVPLSKDTLINVWWYHWIEEMVKVLKAGHRVVFSASWYLNILDKDFSKFYEADPWQMVLDFTKNATLTRNIVGGEACMWGEYVDDSNVLNRVWPKASAVAEVLWSAGTQPIEEAYHRLEEHACRMRRRGIPAQPSAGPGFCLL